MFIFVAMLLHFFCGVCSADLDGEDVFVLINSNSPTSRYVAKLYKEYHPDIPDWHFFELTNKEHNGVTYVLKDCSGPDSTCADEILTRQEYNILIADPIREFLLQDGYKGLLSQIKVIITTAGMPYRIEDSSPVYANVIRPAGSDPVIVKNNVSSVSAASVESELTCLWCSEYGQNPFGTANRMINPYQGYRTTCVDKFERLEPGLKPFSWTIAYSIVPPAPRAEGFFAYPGVRSRCFNAGDFYLTARLDGPKNEGQSAVFVVRKMLERARIASDPSMGVNPLKGFAILDDAPDCSNGNLDFNRVFNLAAGIECLEYDDNSSTPPDADSIRNVDDFQASFLAITGLSTRQDVLNIGKNFQGFSVLLDTRYNNTATVQDDLGRIFAENNTYGLNEPEVVFYSTFGVNSNSSDGDDHVVRSNYLFTGGPRADRPLNFANGAVFTSIESFNAVTMFSNVDTMYSSQGKIVDFISVGGTAAVGHAMEPRSDGAIDTEFLLYNLLTDDNGDGKADVCFVEAAFSAIPYLSWSEVVLGDPLMRLAFNFDQNGNNRGWEPVYGDVNRDGVLNVEDVKRLKMAIGGDLNSPNTVIYGKYDDLCDLNHDGVINGEDIPKIKLVK